MAVPFDDRITQLLNAWSKDDSGALQDLAPLIYDELRRLAARQLRREPAAQTLQTTGLVHEAFLRLVDQRSPRWENRSQFFSIASTLMRRILLDQARARLAEKRGGGKINFSIDAAGATLEGLGENLMLGALEISNATVKRDWMMAKAWLARELAGSES